MNENIFHPSPYVDIQIKPVIKKNNLTAEIVWTYIVARKYEKDQNKLVDKLCGHSEVLPKDSKIWLETYLYPTRIRQKEVKYWRSRADLSIGNIELAVDRESQIQSNGSWICIAESKWFDDIHQNPKFPEILQLSQLIEHALLLHDKNNSFPDKVYITLITPRYFKDQLGKFSERNYWKKYRDYTTNIKLLEKDLGLCPLPFLKHSMETLISRINALELNWVTFEELLDLPNLVEDHIPGKYRTTLKTWEQVFKEIHREDLFVELSK
jgi:hypothetical protein